MNGLDLARYLRQTHPSTKVIVVTGYSTRDIEKTALALSVTALLKKPFGLDMLGEVVRKALNHTGPTATSRARLRRYPIEPLERHISILKRDTGALWAGVFNAEGQLLTHTGLDEHLDRPLDKIVDETWPSQLARIAEGGGPCFLFIDRAPHDIYLSSVGSRSLPGADL